MLLFAPVNELLPSAVPQIQFDTLLLTQRCGAGCLVQGGLNEGAIEHLTTDGVYKSVESALDKARARLAGGENKKKQNPQ